MINDIGNYVSTLVNDPVVSEFESAVSSIPTSLLPVLESVAQEFAALETSAAALAASPSLLIAEGKSLLNVANSALASQPFYTDLITFETQVAGALESIAAQDLGPATATVVGSTGYMSGPSSMITATPNATAIISPALTSTTVISTFTGAAMPMVTGGVHAVMGAAVAAAGVIGIALL